MTKFKVGDKFVPHRPKDIYEPPSWVEEMDEFDGKVLTVSFVNSQNNICTNETTDYTFSPDWCEKVEDTHIPDVREIVDSLELPNNQDHIVEANKMIEERFPDIRKTIDWEQRRYEIAKEFIAAHIAGCISGGFQWFYNTSAEAAIACADEMIKQLKAE